MSFNVQEGLRVGGGEKFLSWETVWEIPHVQHPHWWQDDSAIAIIFHVFFTFFFNEFYSCPPRKPSKCISIFWRSCLVIYFGQSIPSAAQQCRLFVISFLLFQKTWSCFTFGCERVSYNSKVKHFNFMKWIN